MEDFDVLTHILLFFHQCNWHGEDVGYVGSIRLGKFYLLHLSRAIRYLSTYHT